MEFPSCLTQSSMWPLISSTPEPSIIFALGDGNATGSKRGLVQAGSDGSCGRPVSAHTGWLFPNVSITTQLNHKNGPIAVHLPCFFWFFSG
jgi:hypothetical protein